MTVQKTHRYHPIVQVSQNWRALVEAETELATRTPAERADRDRLEHRDTLRREAVWQKEGGPPWAQ